MAANKVIVNNQTILDLTGDTVTAATLKKGVTAHDASGAQITGTMEEASTSETWVLNNKADDTVVSFDCNFTSNGEGFSGLSVAQMFGDLRRLVYGSKDVAVIDYIQGGTNVWTWEADAYRKLIFSTPPTGDLLTWLTANGVKQPANLAVQPSKDVTITSNGTTEITPDAPYDVMEKANLTVNVASGGGVGETTSLEVHTTDSSVDAVLFCLWQTSDGWMGTSNFESLTNFTIPNVIVGGYVIFTHDPTKSWHFTPSAMKGVEEIDVGAMDAEWDVPNAALVMKVTAPSPRFTFLLSP